MPLQSEIIHLILKISYTTRNGIVYIYILFKYTEPCKNFDSIFRYSVRRTKRSAIVIEVETNKK